MDDQGQRGEATSPRLVHDLRRVLGPNCGASPGARDRRPIAPPSAWFGQCAPRAHPPPGSAGLAQRAIARLRGTRTLAARPQQVRSGPVLGRSHLGVSGHRDRDAVSSGFSWMPAGRGPRFWRNAGPPAALRPSDSRCSRHGKDCLTTPGTAASRTAAQADEGYARRRLRHLTCTSAVGQRPLELAARGDVEFVEHLA
jgi:hypothetical protein